MALEMFQAFESALALSDWARVRLLLIHAVAGAVGVG